MANVTVIQVPWHFVLELLIIISGVAILSARVYIYFNEIINYYQLIGLIPDITLTITIIIYISTQVNIEPFYELLKSYRSIIIIWSTIVIGICNITNQAINDSGNYVDWIRTFFDYISYVNAVILVLFIDCVANITNFSRILFPFVLISVTAYNMYLSSAVWPSDEAIFTYKQGQVSIGEIERAAMAQIILYCTTCVFRVFGDKQHAKFTMLTHKIPRKVVLKSSLKVQDQFIGQMPFCCFYIRFSIYYGLVFCFGFIVMFVYVISSIIEYRNPFVSGPLTISWIWLIINALYQHFDFKVILRWFGQFRCWLLILSIIINIYCTIQKLTWNLYKVEDAYGVAHVVINMIAYNGGILLCLCRDGMKQTFPLWFSICLCLFLLFVSSWNAFFIQFDIDDINQTASSWFLELEKEAYYQVNFIMLLILISTWFDRRHLYFVLIVKKRYRNDFFQGTISYQIPGWMLNKGLWYENKSVGISSAQLTERNRYYGSTTHNVNQENNNPLDVTLTSAVSITPLENNTNTGNTGITGITPNTGNNTPKKTIELSASNKTNAALIAHSLNTIPTSDDGFNGDNADNNMNVALLKLKDDLSVIS